MTMLGIRLAPGTKEFHLVYAEGQSLLFKARSVGPGKGKYRVPDDGTIKALLMCGSALNLVAQCPQHIRSTIQLALEDHLGNLLDKVIPD